MAKYKLNAKGDIDTKKPEVVRGNDLYFPQGNEKGDYYEPLFIARINGKSAHGRTQAEALANLELKNTMQDFICDNDNGNTCPHDGARTIILESAQDHTVESCPHCRESFRFWFDDEAALCRCGKPDNLCNC